MAWDYELEKRMRAAYSLRPREMSRSTPVQVTPTADGFVTETAGKVVLTAPGRAFNSLEELPPELASEWQGKVESHPHFTWVQGRYVEGEQANRNGAFWSTDDLEVGQATVKHGPFNWLHQTQKVVGAIVDTKLVQPEPLQSAFNGEPPPTPRPYIAALSVAWKWVHRPEVAVLQMASDMGELYYSMECIAEQMECVETSGGCGQRFDYMTAMFEPDQVCEHIRTKSAHRRMVKPTFLGGAAVVPPARPGWGEANAVVMQRAEQMAAQTAAVEHTMDDARWEMLMASVLAYAAGTSPTV